LAWTPLLAFLLLIVAVPHAAHAFSPLSGDFQIVPKECDCPGSSAGWGCVLLLIKNLITFALSLGVLACVAVLAYAGGLWVLNPLKAEFREQGRGMLINAVVGLVIALAAWLIINTFTVVLTGKGVETWTAQIGIGGKCLPNASDVTGGGTANLGGTTATTTGGTAAGYTYDAGIQAQVGDESPALAAMLACMQPKLPDAAKRISSISDSVITSGQKTFAQCAAGGQSAGCSHAANSCHYGGSCVGKSYAADFGNETYQNQIIAAAQACGAKTLFEGNHIHVSIGAAKGCSCDTGL
jgi:hypothetical protein